MRALVAGLLLFFCSSCALFKPRPPESCLQCRDDYHLCLLEVHVGTAMAAIEAQRCMDDHEVCQTTCSGAEDPQTGDLSSTI